MVLETPCSYLNQSHSAIAEDFRGSNIDGREEIELCLRFSRSHRASVRRRWFKPNFDLLSSIFGFLALVGGRLNGAGVAGQIDLDLGHL
ncbi:MAG TPA: hypothetical protein VKI65_04885, partial [Gemmataceae bacterium]|nr:hypothetical protein [Gemmataceae bacterium]